ncbi:WhiB family transcriptional regulator [Streptomyces sp. NPDC002306]
MESLRNGDVARSAQRRNPAGRTLPAWSIRDSKAACAQPEVDPAIFFPNESHTPRGWDKKAKAICRNCSVISDCLRLAIKDGEVEGVWGGLSPTERYELGGPPPRRLKRTRQRLQRSLPLE